METVHGRKETKEGIVAVSQYPASLSMPNVIEGVLYLL